MIGMGIDWDRLGSIGIDWDRWRGGIRGGKRRKGRSVGEEWRNVSHPNSGTAEASSVL